MSMPVRRRRSGRTPSNTSAAPPGRPQAALSLDDQRAAELFAAAGALGSKVAVLVGLLLWDGMKLGEVLGVDVEQIERTRRGLQATVSRRGESRSVALDRRTANAIRHYLAGRADGPLLLGASPTQPAGMRLTRFGADFLLKQAADHAGLGHGRVGQHAAPQLHHRGPSKRHARGPHPTARRPHHHPRHAPLSHLRLARGNGALIGPRFPARLSCRPGRRRRQAEPRSVGRT